MHTNIIKAYLVSSWKALIIKSSLQLNQIGWTKFYNFTLHHRLFIKTSAHNIQHTNNKKWQYIVELFEEDSLMTRNHSEVAQEHRHRTREHNIPNRQVYSGNCTNNLRVKIFKLSNSQSSERYKSSQCIQLDGLIFFIPLYIKRCVRSGCEFRWLGPEVSAPPLHSQNLKHVFIHYIPMVVQWAAHLQPLEAGIFSSGSSDYISSGEEAEEPLSSSVVPVTWCTSNCLYYKYNDGNIHTNASTRNCVYTRV